MISQLVRLNALKCPGRYGSGRVSIVEQIGGARNETSLDLMLRRVRPLVLLVKVRMK